MAFLTENTPIPSSSAILLAVISGLRYCLPIIAILSRVSGGLVVFSLFMFFVILRPLVEV